MVKMVNGKEVINADKYFFEIKPMPHGCAYGLYISWEGHRPHVLAQRWTIEECKNWIFSHFIGEKGTKFNIKIKKGKIVEDENGFVHIEAVK